MRHTDLAYGIVKRRILLNELTPGSTLTELSLARELGCSQGTVREALLRLQEDGLVTRAGRRGTTVTRLDAEEAEEILALRRRIEVRGAARAVRAADTKAVAELEGIAAAMRSAARSGDEYAVIEADMDFHAAIFRLAGLEALEQILTRCTLHSHRSKLWAPGHRRPLVETAARHDILLAHLARRDGAALAGAIADHIDTIVTVGTLPAVPVALAS